MTDFNSNPDALKATTDGDAGDTDRASTSFGGTAGVDLTSLRENMEVVGSDGGHVGVIDHVLDDQLKLNRQDREALDGQHHLVPLSWVSKIDSAADRVMLNLSKDEATSRWTPAG